MKICSNCGNQINDGDLFCTECGKPVPQGRVCPHCGVGISDDDVFCINCGKKLDEESIPMTTESSQRKCHDCGTLLDLDDVFCPNCGIKLLIEPSPSANHSYEDADVTRSGECTEDIIVENKSMKVSGSYEVSQSELTPTSDNVLVSESEDKTDLKSPTITGSEEYYQEIEYNEEYGYGFDNETQARSGKYLYSIGIIVIICVVGACMWSYYSSSQRAEREIALADSLDQAHKDSILLARKREREKQDSLSMIQEEEKLFLEKFYKSLDDCRLWEEKDEYVRMNVTSNALQTLRNEYDYECSDGDCLAIWLFYSDGNDMDKLISRKIEPISDGLFLVTSTWGYSEGSATIDSYRVKIGIVMNGESYKISSIEKMYPEGKKQGNKPNTDDLTWLQGHWVYEQGHYKAHIKISGNIIQTYSSKNPSPEIATFTIEGDELVANTRGIATAVKIDFVKHKIDWGEGQWMHKVSSGTEQYYSSSDGALNSQQRQRPFTDGQDIMARLYNQRFKHSSGLEIRIDGMGRIEINGDPAGALSVLSYDSESALLRYGNGIYGVGKVLLKIEGNKLLLQDTADGSIFYQR